MTRFQRLLPGLTALLLLGACGVTDEPERSSTVSQEQPLALADTWAAKAARIQQRDLQSNVPLNRWQRLGTHNSHVSTTYTKCGAGLCYYARANQHRSLSAQLDMGIRTLMLDVYDYGCQWGWSVCFGHGGEQFVQWSVALEDEIAQWINAPQNRDEVLFIILEDYFNDDANKRRFFGEIRHRFDRDYVPGASASATSGDLIFRPVDKERLFPSRWPTPAELVQQGKRIVIAVKDRSKYEVSLNAEGYAGPMKDWFFGVNSVGYPSVQYPWYSANFAPSFDGGRCGSADIRDGAGNVQPLGLQFTQFEELKICDHFEACSGLYDTSPFNKRLDVKAAVDCGFSVAMDQAEGDPGYQGQGYDYYSRTLKQAIWSFAEGEPNDAGGDEDCAQMRPDGRWNDVSCGSSSRRHACKKKDATCDAASCPSDYWLLSSSAGAWSAGLTACPQGYAFGVPQNGYENRKLRERIGNEDVWLNFTDRDAEGRWKSAP
jgi:hypothetical protein